MNNIKSSYLLALLTFITLHASLQGTNLLSDSFLIGDGREREDAIPPSPPSALLKKRPNLESIAQSVLDNVLQFRLRTSNSIVAPFQDEELLEDARKKAPLFCYKTSSGSNTINKFKLDELFESAKTSIEYGVANCGEYSTVATFFLLEWQYWLNEHAERLGIHQNFDFYRIRGESFDHETVAIGYPDMDENLWLVIDIWLRKIFPLKKTSFRLKQAGLRPKGKQKSFTFNKIYIEGLEAYIPKNYNLRTVKTTKDFIPCDEPIYFIEGSYNVPYDSPELSYDPAIHEILIDDGIVIVINSQPRRGIKGLGDRF